jgi:tetratricopeptide (TPR) repeat protein
MKHLSNNFIHLIFFSLVLVPGLMPETVCAQSALGQLERMAGQNVSNVNVPQANGPTSEERAEWAAERRDARLAARRVEGINVNKQGNTEFEHKNYKGAIDYYKKALRLLPNDEVVKKNLQSAESWLKYTTDQEVANKEFNKTKQPIVNDFVQPAKLVALSTANIQNSRAKPDFKESNAIGEGSLPEGQNPQVGGLSEAEWAQARESQKQLDILSKKWPLTAAEIALWDASLAKRNALWARAVSIPGLSADERSRLRIKLYTKDVHAGEPSFTVLSEKKYNEFTASPPPPPMTESAPDKFKPETVTPIDLKLFGTYTAEKGDALVEIMSTEHAENAFEGVGIGPLVGLGKIAIAYKQEGVSSALSATGDFLVGLIPIPQASFAVEGGRAYAGVAYQLQNKFMRQALSVTGQTFDEKKFWEDFDRDYGTGVKAVREWVGYGAK